MNFLCRLSGVIALCATTAFAQTATDQIVLDAESALTGGDPATALALTNAALEQSPNNFAALFLRALALSELGQHPEAARTAGQAYRIAQTREEKLQSARLAGGARFAARQYVRAEWWLRQAANHIGSSEDAATIVTEFSRIREENPLSAQFNFNAAPSDNINNGADSDTFRLEGLDIEFGLPPSSVALSGIEYSGDAQLSYRIASSDRQRTSLGLYVFGRTYTLSEDTQDRVPDLSGSDYALALADISINQEWLVSPEGPTSLSLGLGRVWYSGDLLWNNWRVSLRQDMKMGPSAVFGVIGQLEERKLIDDRFPDRFIYTLGLLYTQTLPNNDRLDVSVTGLFNDANDIEENFTDTQLTLGYGFDQAILGTKWSFSVGVGHTEYKEFSLSLDGRRDDYASIGGTVVFEDISYFGFSPSVSVSARRTKSNVDQFTSSQLQARVGISSNF